MWSKTRATRLTTPRLLNLYVDRLIGEFSKTNIGCHLDVVCILNNISYADNMVLLAPSISAMRRLLQI